MSVVRLGGFTSPITGGEMSRVTLKILKDDQTLKTFKSNSAEYAKKYDISNIVPFYEKLYERFM